jgi:hypothetical protein
MPDGVAKQGIAPANAASNRLGVRIQEKFGRVEPVARLRIVRTVYAIAIELAWTYFRQIDVPDLIGLFGEPDDGDLPRAIWPLEQAQIDRGGVFRKERKVDAGAVPRRSRRIWLSWPHLHDVLPLLCVGNLFSSRENNSSSANGTQGPTRRFSPSTGAFPPHSRLARYTHAA